MDSAIQSNLSALLPTWNSALPTPLLDLAHALYAQSRSKAAALKPAEEPARGWACCEIAIERLKQRLNLPENQSRPPCPPKVYKKLYAFLDGALKTVPSTPKKERPSLSVTPSKRLAPRSAGVTPSKTPLASRAPQTELSATIANKRQKFEDAFKNPTPRKEVSVDGDGLPDWSVTTIRHLCKTFGHAEAVPHVYVGVASVSKEAIPRTFKGGVKAQPIAEPRVEPERVPPLIIAVLFLVLERMTGQDVGTAGMRLAVQELVALRRIMVKHVGEVIAEAERLMNEKKTEWVAMDWYQSTPEAVDADVEDELSTHPDRLPDKPARRPAASVQQGDLLEQPASTLEDRVGHLEPATEEVEDVTFDDDPGDGDFQIGLGTMMQEQVNWLSPERRADYSEWKSDIMARIHQMEHGSPMVTT